jgi:hypothetical protein
LINQSVGFVSYVFGALFLSVGLINLLAKRNKYKFSRIYVLIPTGLFLFYVLVSDLVFKRAGLFYEMREVYYFALFVVIVLSSTSINDFKRLLKALSFAFLSFEIVLFFCLFPHLLSAGSWRFGATFGDINYISRICAISVVLFSVCFWKKPFFLLFCILVSCLIGLSTGSRQFALLYLFEIVWLGISFFKQKQGRYFFYLVIGSFLLLAAVNAISGQGLIERYLFFSNNETGLSIDEVSAVSRLDLIKTGFSLFQTNPWFGIGRDGFASQSGYGIYSHCNYIEILVNYGLVGFLLFHLAWLPFPLAFFRFSTLSKRWWGNILIIIILLSVTSFFAVFMFSKIYWVLLATAVSYINNA